MLTVSKDEYFKFNKKYQIVFISWKRLTSGMDYQNPPGLFLGIILLL